MAFDVLHRSSIEAGAKAARALAQARSVPIDVVYWFQRMDGWIFVIASPAVDEIRAQEVHAAIDAALDGLEIDPIYGLGEPILATGPDEPPAAAARGARDEPATDVIDGVPVSTLLGDIVVYDHRPILAAVTGA